MSYHLQSPSIESQGINKKRKRISHESEELAWTAARCNRLLRSITSRIAAIRKLVDRNIPGQIVKPKKTVAKRVASHWSTQDPIWMGDAKRKTGGRTFTGKKKPSKQDASREAPKLVVIAFPSPYVRRICLGETTSPTVPFVRPPPPKARLTTQLPIKPGSPLEEAQEGLVVAFNNILSAPNGAALPKPQGARSLMSTCLKTVPQYIALLEEDENDEDIDTSSGILSYLEDLGTRNDGGWSGLREVVRSQAMYAVCEAIEDGVLSEAIIRQLIDQCGLQNATAEGLEVLTAWTGTGETIAAKQIGTLNTFGREQNCVASTLRLMRTVGQRNFVPLEAFCKTPGFWNILLHSLTRASSFEAESFLSDCLMYCLERGVVCSHGLGLGLKEVTTRLTTMAAAAILLSNTQNDQACLSLVVHRLAANVIFSSSEVHSEELGQLLINCSLFLLGVSSDSYGTLSIATISDVLPSKKMSRLQSPHFADEIVSSIATLEHHLDSDLTGLLLERMVEMSGAALLYRQIALAAVAAKQQSSESDPEDQALYAEYINRISLSAASNTDRTPQTPFPKQPETRFRWEEGICEWVAKTPFTAATIAPPTPLSLRMAAPEFNDKENRGQSGEEMCGSIKKQTCPLQNSPDVLTLSPQKRAIAESPLRPRQAKRKRTSQPKVAGRRRTSRISSRSCAADESADELGF